MNLYEMKTKLSNIGRQAGIEFVDKKQNRKKVKTPLIKQGFVYFIQSGFNGPIKIGWAIDPLERLKILQTGSAEKLVLLGCIRGTLKTEKEMHKKLYTLRINNEWFHNDLNLINLIKEKDCRKEYGLN